MYRISGVLAVPLNTKEEAEAAILKYGPSVTTDASSISSSSSSEADNDAPPSLVSDIPAKRKEDGFNLGAYLWSPTGLAADRKPPLNSATAPKSHRQTSSIATLSPEEVVSRRTLDGKVLRETIREISHGGMYYSVSTDVTHHTQAKASRKAEHIDGKHLWQQADRRFFFNRFLSGTFVDAGLHELVYPIFQYVLILIIRLKFNGVAN